MLSIHPSTHIVFFFFNDTATTEIYTLSLHDALPISLISARGAPPPRAAARLATLARRGRRRSLIHHVAAFHRVPARPSRSEEHTSELQSRQYLVCRLLLEKKKKVDHTDLYVRDMHGR